MFPLRDNIPSRTFPIVNYTMIGLCALVFLAQLIGSSQELEDSGQGLVERYGMIPALVRHPDQTLVVPEQIEADGRRYVVTREIVATINPWWTLLTCIFLHGGWMHFLGNMWFLHIFGDNVEDRLGHVGYAVFYLFSGVMASFTHLITNGNSPVPTIGASGAIAGVRGAYMLLYPRAMVVSLVPIFVLQILVLPAPIFLGIWFLMQFVQGTAAITGVETTGVAWWAHIGGFAVGAAVAAVLRNTGHTEPPIELRRPGTDHAQMYRYHR